MKARNSVKFIFFIFLVLFSFLLMLFIPAKYDDIMSIGFNKFDTLKSAGLPKIVFVGGSSVMYGIDTNILVNNLPYDIVSLGYYVGIGMDYYYKVIPQYLKSGDIVVLTPEYELLNMNILPDNQAGKWLFPQNPGAYFALMFKNDLIDFAENAIIAIQEKVKALFLHGFSKRDEYFYYSSRFDERGNVIFKNFPPSSPTSSLSGVGERHFYNESAMSRSIDNMNIFYDAMIEKGVDVVFLHQSLPYIEFARASHFIDEFQNKIIHSLKVPILGKSSDFVFSIRYFYDSVYHLAHEGRMFRTMIANNLLVDYLRKGTKVDLPDSIQRTDPVQQITDEVISPKKISYMSHFMTDFIWTDGHGYLGWFSLQLHDQAYLKLQTFGFSPFMSNIDKMKLNIFANNISLQYVCKIDTSFYFKLPSNMKEINEIKINSSTFVPKDIGINSDPRSLGIDVDTIEVKRDLDMSKCSK